MSDLTSPTIDAMPARKSFAIDLTIDLGIILLSTVTSLALPSLIVFLLAAL